MLDISALLAVLLNQGPKSEIISKTTGNSLIVPASLHWELGNALSSLFKRRKISPGEAEKVVDEYRRIPLQFVDIDLKAAVKLAHDHSVYAYDAYMILCAKQHRVPILSLDNALIEVARREKIRVVEV